MHAMHAAVRAVDLVFHAAGTNAIYTRNPLERYFRDIHVAVQHNTAFPRAIRIRWQGADGFAPHRHGLVTAEEQQATEACDPAGRPRADVRADNKFRSSSGPE